MNIRVRTNGEKTVAHLECVMGVAFKMEATRDQSALLSVICVDSAVLREKRAHFYRFGCLLPHRSFA